VVPICQFDVLVQCLRTCSHLQQFPGNLFPRYRPLSSQSGTVYACMLLFMFLVSLTLPYFPLQEFLGNKNRSTILPASIAFFLGGVCCAIRFTSLVCYIPIGIILSMQQQSLSRISYLLRVCFLPGLCGLIMTLLLDRAIYGFWAIPFLGNIHFNVLLGTSSITITCILCAIFLTYKPSSQEMEVCMVPTRFIGTFRPVFRPSLACFSLC
jgi:hypothetical protein